MVSVVFPAAGQAHRMQVGLNKVFLTLAGKPMLLRTLLTFSKVPDVGELIVAVGADEVEPVTSLPRGASSRAARSGSTPSATGLRPSRRRRTSCSYTTPRVRSSAAIPSKS